MIFQTELYMTQNDRWPQSGRHVMAHFDDNSIIVYQAYRPAIASYAVEHQKFGGDFSFSRMSWIKPNFLWMMFRSGWATKPDQERILAVQLQRDGFDAICRNAVASSYDRIHFESAEVWQDAVKASNVRLQWDPDHDPHGNPLERRAVQLGLRGDELRKYGTEWVMKIEDITQFVHEQKQNLDAGKTENLLLPTENHYPAPHEIGAEPT